ncbi:MAG: DUF3011 domain-containing protein [Rhodanobacter sp.]
MFTALLVAAMTFSAGPLQAQSRTEMPVRKTVTCHSNANEFQRCNVHRWEDLELIRQASRTPCVRGENWGRDGEWMWVSGGCRGEFAEVRRGYASRYRYANRGQVFVREDYAVSCASNSQQFKRCNVGPWDDAVLLQQDSGTPCVRGKNWDLDGISIWVNGGCRGSFAEVRRDVRPLPRSTLPARHRPSASVDPWNREIRFECASTDNKYQFCSVDVGRRGSVEMESQQSRADCVRDQSWGWNRAGIWVSKGCRAKFVVYRQR